MSFKSITPEKLAEIWDRSVEQQGDGGFFVQVPTVTVWQNLSIEGSRSATMAGSLYVLKPKDSPSMRQVIFKYDSNNREEESSVVERAYTAGYYGSGFSLMFNVSTGQVDESSIKVIAPLVEGAYPEQFTVRYEDEGKKVVDTIDLAVQNAISHLLKISPL